MGQYESNEIFFEDKYRPSEIPKDKYKEESQEERNERLEYQMIRSQIEW